MSDILTQLHNGQLLIINSRKRNGLILFKSFHAEFAGPGAAIGGMFDRDCRDILPVGDLSLLKAANDDERQKAYRIRRQWIRLTQQITDNPSPAERVKTILQQFNNYFETETVELLPNDAFALLVGVLPQTVGRIRRTMARS
ncbi:MAG: hypothetical protein VKJ24_08190 [Synechococcales bacterium]|nr:hypothetical protein [Synechococcales bacterium]